MYAAQAGYRTAEFLNHVNAYRGVPLGDWTEKKVKHFGLSITVFIGLSITLKARNLLQ